ncbi:arsenic resistance protein [Desulfallas sp. Bu1-1]|uniref:arsenic resistance protein n=1 Tax=Desulfallas sp. Bu1-1 TaxID=2787620 RepID=UPI00189D417F|nr:bile acid:sodium symporter [Desulfallas sp. Bu1-1]MBF7082969.1 arsenic resistance protein [Desulfallas sp. Bu1-1]
MRVANFINKHLIALLMGVICLGLFLGYLYPESGKRLEIFYPLTLFIMLFPMMVTIKISEVVKASKRLGFMTVVTFLNYIVSPLLAALLGYIFLSGYPDFAIGLIINGTVPCGGMIVAWTAMSRGNTPLTLVIVVISLLAGILLIPFWIWALAGKYVPVDPWNMLHTIFYTIVVPLFLGNITRIGIIRKWGREKFDELKSVFSAVSALGFFAVFFIAMMSQSEVLLKNPQYLGIVTLPLIVFYVLLLGATILYAWFARINYPDMVSLFYGVNAKNASIALALAVVFFSPLTVLILAVKPVVQVIFMTIFYKISPYLQEYWVKVSNPSSSKCVKT